MTPNADPEVVASTRRSDFSKRPSSASAFDIGIAENTSFDHKPEKSEIAK
jgi:hypothetical protein